MLLLAFVGAGEPTAWAEDIAVMGMACCFRLNCWAWDWDWDCWCIWFEATFCKSACCWLDWAAAAAAVAANWAARAVVAFCCCCCVRMDWVVFCDFCCCKCWTILCWPADIAWACCCILLAKFCWIIWVGLSCAASTCCTCCWATGWACCGGGGGTLWVWAAMVVLAAFSVFRWRSLISFSSAKNFGVLNEIVSGVPVKWAKLESAVDCCLQAAATALIALTTVWE